MYICDKNMSFNECELEILRKSVDKIGNKQGKKQIDNPEIREIILIVEEFLKNTKRLCYGGTAINNLLPIEDQFYDKDIELPDYDFFSPTPLQDAKNLANMYYDKGFKEVEAKAGMHSGTFKVYVNFLPIADITYLVPEIYNNLSKESIQVKGIYYSPPTFLRMAMYLELSRPAGDVSRWEKVMKRLVLLNKHYPLRGKNCNILEIQRLFQYNSTKNLKGGKNDFYLEDEDLILKTMEEKIFFNVRETLINQGCIFFGSYANRMYLKNLKKLRKKKIPKVPDFDVLSLDPEGTARVIKERLTSIGVKKVSHKKHDAIGEIIPLHYEIKVGLETILIIYKPLGCHSYNIVNIDSRNIRIATLDTMLSLYLAFLYGDKPYYNSNRILCMSEFLFRVQQKNRLKQDGILKRFSIDCYGDQLTKEGARSEKSHKYKELKGVDRDSKEWEWWFLNYIPNGRSSKQKKISPTRKKKSKNNTRKKLRKNKNTHKRKKRRKKKTRKGFFKRLGFR